MPESTNTANPTTAGKNGRRQRVLSGITATGSLTIGNYVGAISVWAEQQAEYDNLFFIANLHALTIPEAIKPQELRQKAQEIAALYIACGLDPARSIIFRQSDMPEHTYLSWIMECCTPLGWLQRMTQFKSKSQRAETISSGLLTYPALQAADILIYHADYVPVGDDQTQHVELTRDIAERFNHLYGEYFTIPKAITRSSGARIMGLDDPTAKMSKSTAMTQERHAIRLLDDPKAIRKAIMSAVTDSGSEIHFDQASPGVLNLLVIYEVLTGESRPVIEATFAGQGYGTLKRTVADVVIETLRPIQEKYHELTDDPAYIEGILADGATRARVIAEKTIRDVRELVGV